MILADTSVWIDHFRKKDPVLSGHLQNEGICIHPFIIGEIACGNMENRDEIIGLLKALPAVLTAADDEVLLFIEINKLYGRGLGYIDMHLLASAFINDAELWTKDKRLGDAYSELIKK